MAIKNAHVVWALWHHHYTARFFHHCNNWLCHSNL